MSEPYHEETYRGYQLKIYPDDFHDDLDGLMGDGWFGHFVQFTQYEMGSWTDHPFEPLQLRSFTEKDNIMALPVYMYEHGGIRLKIGSGWPNASARRTSGRARTANGCCVTRSGPNNPAEKPCQMSASLPGSTSRAPT